MKTLETYHFFGRFANEPALRLADRLAAMGPTRCRHRRPRHRPRDWPAFPGPTPTIVRSEAFPDLFTEDRHPLLGWLDENSRVYCATGFSGKGFKMATGYGHIAAHEALGKQTIEGLDFVRPDRFKTG
ncbi:hypothetical protein [Streptomyces sp. TLI_185]|uniref:hypothetical protein n=1 Tax=Streptomyces sp. TLI_185 TaxID=2485151 RepID=UPI0021A64442|nr:hypothetical protein [Streptomyces sp. TLI_185]